MSESRGSLTEAEGSMRRVCAKCGWDASFHPPEVTYCLACGAGFVSDSTKTVWVEDDNGGGHWASNWELQQMEAEHQRLMAQLDIEEFEGGYPWPNL